MIDMMNFINKILDFLDKRLFLILILIAVSIIVLIFYPKAQANIFSAGTGRHSALMTGAQNRYDLNAGGGSETAYNVTDNGWEAYRVTDNGGEDYNVQ
jgi:hypothetical protein